MRGPGIGLALVKEIMTAHQGKISRRERLGRGSTFTLSLPTGRCQFGLHRDNRRESFLLPNLRR